MTGPATMTQNRKLQQMERILADLLVNAQALKNGTEGPELTPLLEERLALLRHLRDLSKDLKDDGLPDQPAAGEEEELKERVRALIGRVLHVDSSTRKKSDGEMARLAEALRDLNRARRVVGRYLKRPPPSGWMTNRLV